MDPTGKDSTFYIQDVSQRLNSTQQQAVQTQVQSVLNQNGIPMKVQSVGAALVLDKTDVKVMIMNDNQQPIKKQRQQAQQQGRSGSVEGVSVVGSQVGATSADILTRTNINVNISGLGNTTAHEGFHAMGLSHSDPSASSGSIIYPASVGVVTDTQINNPIQTLSVGQKSYIMNVFLNPAIVPSAPVNIYRFHNTPEPLGRTPPRL